MGNTEHQLDYIPAWPCRYEAKIVDELLVILRGFLEGGELLFEVVRDGEEFAWRQIDPNGGRLSCHGRVRDARDMFRWLNLGIVRPVVSVFRRRRYTTEELTRTFGPNLQFVQ